MPEPYYSLLRIRHDNLDRTFGTRQMSHPLGWWIIRKDEYNEHGPDWSCTYHECVRRWFHWLVYCSS